MLVGRETAQQLVDAALAGATSDRGSVVWIWGEAGIGKTALLDDALSRLPAEVLVLRAAGHHVERHLAHVVLADLLEPVHPYLAALSAPQRAALEAALVLGPPVTGDPVAVPVAVRSLVAAVAAERPVVVAVDDVHHVDDATLACLWRLARRPPPQVAVALASREPSPLEVPAAGLGPLDDEGAQVLLRSVRPGIAPGVARTIAASAAGLPLALVEVADALSDDQVTGAAALPQPLPAGTRLRLLYDGHVRALDPDGRCSLAALVVAGPALVAAVSQHLGLGGSALATAEQAGLVSLGPPCRLRHPLLEEVVLAAVGPDVVRRIHAVAADLTDGDRRAWHLAGAADGPDPVAAAALCATGLRAARSGAPGEAARAFARAADLGAGVDAELWAGEGWLVAGAAAAAGEVLERAMAAGRPGQRRRALGLLAVLALRTGSPAVAIARYEEAAGDAADASAARFLAEAALAATVAGDCRQAHALATRARAALPADSDPALRALVLASWGWTSALVGHTAEARGVFEAVDALHLTLDPSTTDGQSLVLALNSRLPLGDHERALAEAQAGVARATEAGALSALPVLQLVAADAAWRLGRWSEAGAACEAGRAAADDLGQLGPLAHLDALTARVAAGQGRFDVAYGAADRALTTARQLGMASVETIALAARGFLHLSADRPAEAVADLREVERLQLATGLAEPSLVPWAPDLVEALARLGRVDEATDVVAALEQAAAVSGGAWVRLAAARARGTVAGDPGPWFAEADRLLPDVPSPFERGRTELAHGAALHRRKRRQEARAHLRVAVRAFDEVGAAPWAALAGRVLRSAGGRPDTPSVAGELTAQERQVAALAAKGATNKEVAAALLIGTKTVEMHLGRVFRKLGVRNRTELALALEDREG